MKRNPVIQIQSFNKYTFFSHFLLLPLTRELRTLCVKIANLKECEGSSPRSTHQEPHSRTMSPTSYFLLVLGNPAHAPFSGKPFPTSPPPPPPSNRNPLRPVEAEERGVSQKDPASQDAPAMQPDVHKGQGAGTERPSRTPVASLCGPAPFFLLRSPFMGEKGHPKPPQLASSRIPTCATFSGENSDWLVWIR